MSLIILVLLSVIFNIFTIVMLIGICNYLLAAEDRFNQAMETVINEARKRLQNHPEN